MFLNQHLQTLFTLTSSQPSQTPEGEEGEEAHISGGQEREEGGQDSGHRHRGLHHLLAALLCHGCGGLAVCWLYQ